MRNITTITAIAIVAMSSCNKDEQYSTSDNQVAVKFASSEITTRTSGNSWVADDLIGISMYNSGDTTTPLAENIEYSSDTEGNFSNN